MKTAKMTLLMVVAVVTFASGLGKAATYFRSNYPGPINVEACSPDPDEDDDDEG